MRNVSSSTRYLVAYNRLVNNGVPPHPIVKAELNYTTNTGRWQDRKWDSIPAERNDGRISANLPAGTRVYYFNLVDDRNCVVSTEHQERN